MKLNLPFLEKKLEKEYFLALILRNEKAGALIFEKVGNSIKPVGQDEEYFDKTVEEATPEELLTTLDKIISKAEESLPPSIETKKTIFGLKDNWIEDNKIRKEYLDKLKKISDKLSLTPVGFIVFTEAMISLLQKEEGAPVTAILSEIGKKYLTVSLVKASKIIETKTSEIYENPSFTVDTLLKHFQTPEILPSKIFIINDGEKDLSQEFISHQWSKSLPFLHLPQTVNLPKESSFKAMLYAAGVQMGAVVLSDFIKKEPEKIGFDEEESKDVKITEPETPQEPERIEPEVEETIEDEEKIQEFQPTEPEETKGKIDYVGEELSKEYFGFSEEVDVAQTPKPEIPKEPEKELEKESETSKAPMFAREIEEIPEGLKLQEEKEEVPGQMESAVLLAKKTFPKIINSFKKLPLGSFTSFFNNSKGIKKLLIPLVILILLVLGLFFITSKSTAKITISVSPKEDQQTKSVTFSPSGTDVGNDTIGAEFMSVSENGQITTQATGKKDVGDKAKGTITIFNNDPDNSQSFPSGTTVKSSDGKEFTTDSQVTVTAATSDPFQGTKPSTSNVNVTASDIGQDYNLPSGTKFSIGTSSFVAAKNDNAFSGGTKKQVTVVSKDDISKASDQLVKQLESKAKDDIKSKVDGSNEVLPGFIDTSLDNQSTDKKEGDQANQFTLKATVNYKGVTYKKDDILNLADSLFKSSNQVVNKDNFSVEANNIKTDGDNVTSDLTIKASLIPEIDQNSIIKDILGFEVNKAKNYISNLPQVSDVKISVSPSIPLLPKNLPKDPGKISVSVVSQ